MDEEVDPDCRNVNSVLDQESLELFQVLCSQEPPILMKLWRMMPREDGCQNQKAFDCSTATSIENHVKILLEYFTRAKEVDCRNFLQSVCMECVNIPMRLETRLMSVAGDVFSECFDPPTNENDQRTSQTPLGEQPNKRPRIDYWERYTSEVMNLLQRRWGRLTERLVKEVQLEKVWVGLRTLNRQKDRPDQTPGSIDRGSRTPEFDGEYGSLESRLTLETFLQGCGGKVTVLAGQAGSGKTLLMSLLGQQWSNGLGPIPSSHLFVHLEFRHLNTISRSLSLSELLFQFYLPPSEDTEAKKAVVDYLLSNPEQSCWVLDGYDEFHTKFNIKNMQSEPLDLEKPFPVAELISGLLNRQLLAGSTILVTCRVRDVIDFDGLLDKVGELIDWDRHEVTEYMTDFFGEKDRSLGERAKDLLLSNRHLLAMSSLPALCNICCIFLRYLLLEGKRQNQHLLEESNSNEKVFEQEKQPGNVEESSTGENLPSGDEQNTKTEGRDGTIIDNGLPDFLTTIPEIPTTRTQVYLSVIAAFLGQNTIQRSSACVLTSLRQYRSKLCELSRLAWSGLETNKLLFLEEDIPKDVLEFSVKAGLLSQVELRVPNGTFVNAYCFIHLTVQEFLAALRVMTSDDISDAKLKKRFSLKTRWTTKSDQKTVFTDSLYLYVCGLSSPHCTEALAEVARASGIKAIPSWVKKRQALVLKLLNPLCRNSNLTGPKILQLCHCVQETQDQQLAKLVMSIRPTLELRNFWLSPNDVEALAFVVNSVGNNGTGLDFRACSMELECLDALSRCHYIRSLNFRSRKYGDKFAEKLSTVLPDFKILRKLEFCGASLTATGAACLMSGLQDCPDISDINLSDNNLQDEGIRQITPTFTKLQSLSSIKLGQNNTSLKAVEYLIKELCSSLNVKSIHADGTKEVVVTFFKECESHKTKSGPSISFLNQNWNDSDMANLAKSLTNFPVLSVLDLSGGHWDEKTLRTLTEFVPKLKISKRIILNGSYPSVKCVVALTALLSDCTVMELNIRRQSPAEVKLVFTRESEKPVSAIAKKLSLSCCHLQAADFEKVWKSLGISSDVTVLDLSCNRLGDKGLEQLLGVLFHLSKILEINISHNEISMNGVVMLAGALCSSNNLNLIHVSNGGKEQVILKFNPSQSKEQIKIFRIDQSNLEPSNVKDVCEKLVSCPCQLDLEFLHCSFTDNSMENLFELLPTMTSLQKLDVSYSIADTTNAVTLIRCLKNHQRVSSVELSPQSESFICFNTRKANQVSCRLVHFCFKQENVALEKLLGNLTQQLSYLDLSNNQLEDEQVKIFMDSLPLLKITDFVNLSNNNLTQHGALDAASSLRYCSNVSEVEVSLGEEKRCLIWFSEIKEGEKTLSISESEFSLDHLLKLAEIVSSCPSLTKIELKKNKLQMEWIEKFVKLLNVSESRSTVSVEEDWIVTEKVVSLLCFCMKLSNNIQIIRIHHTTLQLSLRTPEQTTVSLSDCAVVDNELPPMGSVIIQSPSLEELDFSRNSLDSEETRFLCSLLSLLPNLSSFSIAFKETTGSVAEEFSNVLQQHPSIQYLNLSGHVITDTAAQNLTTFLPRLRSLNLSGCVCSASGWLQLMQTLENCINMENLCLDYVQLNGLTTLNLAPRLRKMNSLQRLKLDGWRMADEEMEMLTMFVPAWKDLRVISLCKNRMSDESGEKLLEALSGCVHLQELCLSSNVLGDLTAARMALVLPLLTHLTVLDVAENKIGKDGLTRLSEAIKTMRNLTKINLTSVGTSELCAVVASLVHCPVIQDVSLGWNNCADDVALELAKVLPFCHRMTRIDLESNSVSVDGVDALVNSIRASPALRIIRLWKNKLSVSEIQRLGQTEKRLNFSSTS